MRGARYGAAVLLAALVGAPAEAQDAPTDDGPIVRLSTFVGGSLRERPDGLGLADDVLSASVRATLPRRGFQPWAQVEAFRRPNLACPAGIPCNTEGWTALAGVVAPITPNDMEPGAHPYFLAGIGWAFSEESQFAYTLGAGVGLALTRRVAPSAEVRWEELPGIRNVVMLNLGLRVDLF
ncbi:MAG: hypothetical protein R3314_03285 [Longimicrobiales bacterium]|nr:hypothetical protein [Longimicrobiales bacterium]